MSSADLSPIYDFLHCITPESWVKHALTQLPTLLIDHANCEKKAAQTALGMLYRYDDQVEMCQKMSRLAREELRHFEQVLKIIQKRGIPYEYVPAALYAQNLQKHARKAEPDRLIDKLIIGAIIEARSCERFAVLAPHLDEELNSFYSGLLLSEARHFEMYLQFARQYAKYDITSRVNFFLEQEALWINTPDAEFRFHSGTPVVEA